MHTLCPRKELHGGRLGFPAAGGRCIQLIDLSLVSMEPEVKLRRQLLLRRWPRRSETKDVSNPGTESKIGSKSAGEQGRMKERVLRGSNLGRCVPKTNEFTQHFWSLLLCKPGSFCNHRCSCGHITTDDNWPSGTLPGQDCSV